MADSHSSKTTIIVDTNILYYLGDERGFALKEYLQDLVQKNYELAISIISIIELFSTTDINKHKKRRESFESFVRVGIEEDILFGASYLATLYKMERIPDTQISSEDTIIASTAMLTNSLILTANGNDFPRPFFKEHEEKLLYYKKKGNTQVSCMYLLEPNTVVLKERLKKLER